MYDLLTTAELTVLQSMLYEGTEDAFRVAGLYGRDPCLLQQFRPMHQEVAHLFIEAGLELVVRLDREVRVA